MTRERGVRRLLLALATAGAVLAGCAGSSTRPPPAPAGSNARSAPARPAYDALVRAAERRAQPRPDAAPPPGLDPDLARPIEEGTDAWRLAHEPLDRALASLREDRLPPREFPSASAADREAAVRRYVIGREKLLRGDARGAAEDLQAATRLDPGAPEPWRELGECQLAMGSPSEAAVSMQAAVERGLREARVLEFLGRVSDERGEHERAAGWFARAAALNPRAEDPALPLVVRVGLGRSILKTGRLAAGREALARALELPAQPPGPTRYVQETAAIYRRQRELWREVGDADCRLGEYARALDAYTRAAGLPASEDVDLAPRVFFTATRAGRPAAAAVFALDRISAAGGMVSRDDLELLSILAQDRAVAQQLARALAEVRASLPAEPPPSVGGSLERARAAVLGADEGARLLRAHLARFPADAVGAGDLLRLSSDAVADAADLAGATPEYADRYADALARAVPDAVGAAERLRGMGGDGAGLLAVYLLARIGDQEAAWRHAQSLRSSAGRPEVAVLRVRLAAAQGRWPEAEEALAAIRPDASWARARALSAMGRPAEALDLLEKLTPPGDDTATRFERLLMASDVALHAGKPEQAEDLLRRAISLDPSDDRPYALQLSLYGPGGPLADAEQLARVLRDLRARVADGRLAAFIRAQEFVRRSFLQQAERELLELAKPDPTDASVLELLSAVWTRLAPSADDPDFARAVAWLDEQSASRPWADTLIAAKARVLATAGRADDAESMLRARLARRPTPEVSHVLEILLRDRGKADEADSLAEARLSAPPVSIVEAIELAELRARRGQDEQAAGALRDHVPPAYVLDPATGRRVLALAVAIMSRSAQEPDSRAAALWLLDDLVRRGVRLPVEGHQNRLALLAATESAGEERLIGAAEDALREYPQLGAAVYVGLSRALEEQDRAAAALAIVERAAGTGDPGPDLLLEWMRLASEAGGAEHGRRLVRRCVDTGNMGAVLARLYPDRQEGSPAMRDDRGAVAFAMAGRASVIGRVDAAEELYELCLEYDPGHPWASNNLGYSMLERGGDLDRAEQLLVTANESLPNQASILDSLGWLRYKRGVIEDVVDGESGQVVREGAVTLLVRAVEAASQREGGANATILDHCGDALWAAGQRAEARQRWSDAVQAADRDLRRLRAEQRVENADRRSIDKEVADVSEVRQAARRKARAAEGGREPEIAPRAGAEPSGGE